ncbi:MAG: ATP-binding protein [Halarcobacter sp.]
MKNKKFIYMFLFYILISISIYFLSINYIHKEEQKLLDQKYISVTKQINKNLNTLIQDKQNATLVFAISVARDTSIRNSLLQNNPSLLDLDNFSNTLKINSDFKNIWFQIITKEGKSFYRSWSKENGDSLLFRDDIEQILKNKKILSTISVGRYDMTFKSMIPIFHQNKFIGIFEIISHFNSISKILEADGIDNIFLADKRFKSYIKLPFTKKFIGDYYIANLNAKDYLIDSIKSYGIEKILNSSNTFLIIDKQLVSTHKISNQHGLVGFSISSKNLSTIDISNINSFKRTAIIYVSLSIVLIGFIIGIINYSLYSNKINRLNKKLKRNIKLSKIEKEKTQTILDSQENIIVLTDGKNLNNANNALFKFFSQYKNLEEFKKEHECICETFIDMENDDYVLDIDYNGKNWAEYILENSHKNFKAAIKKDDIIHHFTLNVNLTQFEGELSPYIIVTLTDITQEIQQQKLLKNLNENLEHLVDEKTKELKDLNESLEERINKEIQKSKEKDNILFQQNKMLAIGEMLSNIAHQWRQPLSCITTAASSLQIQNDLKTLNDEELHSTCDYIIESSKYLSKTIEDFKSFFRHENKQQDFLIKDTINNNLNLLKENLRINNIEVVLDIDENQSIFGFKNEFQQAILNIFNNSVDAFLDKKIQNRRLILIQLNKHNLIIKDSAHGVDETIIDKIFEPYFTTKHQSQGTGLSLYMTREILTNHLNCSIDVYNVNFTYEKKEYKGLEFSINFNQ